jgi:hypothetical protein
VVSLGSYLLGAAELAMVVLSLGLGAFRLRRRLLPAWTGPPARLVESIVAVALLIWLSEILGTFGFLYAGSLIASCVLTACAILWLTSPSGRTIGIEGQDAPTGPAGRCAMSLIAVGVVALVVAHWAITTKHALDRGIFNFDSLWYHMPLATDIAQSHSVTGVHQTGTVFTTWFYPQNSELLHAVGILITHRDTLSLFVNFGWLAVAFLAAWCIGRPYGRGHLSVVAVAILLECHTLVVREPGAAKDDLATAAPLLAAIAILVNAWSESGRRLPVGWPLAAAGLAVGLAAGTKVTALAMAAALSVAVLALAPTGRRWAAAGRWFVPALLGGGFWYLRNLIVAGNPLPVIAHFGPITLPHPEGLQTLRPDFSIAHYATDTGIWRHYFAPGLHDQFGALWPLVVGAALLAAILALARGRDRIVRWMGAVALLGMVAYVFTPLSASGAEGAPVGFAINVRYVVPAMLAALALLPLPRAFDQPRRQWVLLGVLLVVLLVTDRSDTVLRDPERVFGVLLAVLLVLIPAGILFARARWARPGLGAAGFAALAVVIVAIGYPVQRHYLHERFRNEVADESIPGMHLDSAYRWARGIGDARIGLAGTSAGFAQFGFYGTDLSNRVLYLGEEGPHGAFNAIPTCRGFRAAVDAADLDYLVTAPFLNFIHPGRPIPSPEARWLRGEPAVAPILHSGPVTVWKVQGSLDPAACGPANAPLREIPDTRATDRRG